MTTKNLFSIAAFFTLLLGIAWMLFPESLLSAWGILSSPALVYLSRRYAVLFLGNAVILWFAREESETRTGRAIVGGSFVSSVLIACMSLYGILSAAFNASGWMAFGLEVSLAAGFGYLLFGQMKKRMKLTLPKKLMNKVSLIGLMVLVLVGCAPKVPVLNAPTAIPSLTPQAQSTSRVAQVQSVEIQTLQTNPPQINAIVHGNLTESCATLGESQVQYASNTFQISVYAVSPGDRACMQTTTPFETMIPLTVSGLPTGAYTVTANGVSAIFTLPVSNAEPSTTTPLATLTPTPIESACIDAAMFVSDVTIPDNTVIASNTPFTKTWKLKNSGTCTWDSSYLIAYISGATMAQQPGYWIVQQGQTVTPGETVNVSVGMTSPVENGNYSSYWGLKKVDGQFMSIQGGANGNSFYVKIQVNNGSVASGNITAQSIDIEPEQGSGIVCTANSTYFVHASITADGPTTAAYEIGSTAGQIPAGNFQNLDNNGVSPYVTGAVVFDQAGTKTINIRFVGPYPYPSDITVNLRVNDGEWHNAKLSCPQ